MIITYHRKNTVQPMYPYEEGMDMKGISVSKGDTPEVGGMIAFNPCDPKDQWYIAKEFFEKSYDEVKIDANIAPCS